MHYFFCCTSPSITVLELYALLLHELSCPVFSVRHLSLIKVTLFSPVQCRAANRCTMWAYIIVPHWQCSPAGGGWSLLFESILFSRKTLDFLLLSGDSINWDRQTSSQFRKRASIWSRLCGRCCNIILISFQRVQHLICELGSPLRLFTVLSP